jgi:DNA-binding CsgD family transcriptional regulator
MAEQHSAPLLLVNGKLSALFVNPAARRLARRKKLIRLRGKDVCVKDPVLRVKLVDAMGRVSSRRPHIGRVTSPLGELVITCLRWGPLNHPIFVIAVSELAPVDRVDKKAARELFRLSPTEAEIVATICRGASRMEIAQQRRVSIHTVKSHLTHIFQKLGVHSQAAVIRRMAGMTASS